MSYSIRAWVSVLIATWNDTIEKIVKQNKTIENSNIFTKMLDTLTKYKPQ